MQTLDEAAVLAYVQQRSGSVLGKGTILKDDRLPVGTYRADLPVRLNGAPNFRRAPGTPLWACGQPSANGVRTVLNFVRPSAPSILWVNLRHEPIVYVNQRPYLLRLLESALAHMSVPGLELSRLDLMESRMAADVEREAETAGGNVLLHEEVQDGAVVASLEAVVPASSARTPAALFEELKNAKSGQLLYARVPLSPDEMPSPADVDNLLAALATAPPKSHIVFNCQLGKGRSTLAQCMALLYLQAKGTWTAMSRLGSAGTELPQFAKSGIEEEEHAYRQQRKGEFNLITQLLRLLPHGTALKAQVDVIVDLCNQCEDLRMAIVLALTKADAARSAAQAAPHLERAMRTLGRYYILILLAAYFDELGNDFEKLIFSKWLAERAELWALLERALKNPRAALGVAEAVGGIPFQRTGAVLSAGMILKSDHISSVRRLPPFASSAPAPFIVSASPTKESIEQVIADLKPGEKILWINLREEPTIYLNGKPFSLRSAAQPLRNSDEYAGIAVARLEDLEVRLKKDAQSEARKFQGGVLVHDETSQGPLSTRWEKGALVQTPAELFASFGNVVTYTRVPLTPEAAPEPRDFDALRSLLVTWQPAHGPIVLADQNGKGRAAVAVLSALIMAHYQNTIHLPVPHDAAEIHPEQQFVSINNLVRALPNGPAVKRQVNYFVMRCGDITYDLLEKVESLRLKAAASRDAQATAAHTSRALRIIARYASLLPFAAYCAEEVSRGLSVPFVAWCEQRAELVWLMAEIAKRPEELLRRPMPESAPDTEATVERIVRLRKGGVLSSGTILKPDHFPGCQRMSLVPILPGAPNYRRIAGLSVCGVAMPTTAGMRSVLQACDKKKVLWVNLREEPVLYVLGMPYVLRNLVVPFANLEYTGIDTERVHDMERRLKEEVLADAAQNEGKVLLHEEGADGKMTTKLETVDAHAVQTPSEVYAALQKEGLHVSYARVPITDEKPPEPKDFDQLLGELRTHDPTKGDVYIFNCQMGRGRTTTGTVVAALYCLRMGAPPKDAYLTPLLHTKATTPSPVGTPIAPRPGDTSFVINGEYPEIMALVRALANGPAAKEELDVVIDQCSQMQNLREAIGEMAVRAASQTGDSRAGALWRARLYLERYFYLLAFAAYLLDGTALSFSDWLRIHTEIDGILAKGTSLKN